MFWVFFWLFSHDMQLGFETVHRGPPRWAGAAEGAGLAHGTALGT